jgi:hypothetical protein
MVGGLFGVHNNRLGHVFIFLQVRQQKEEKHFFYHLFMGRLLSSFFPFFFLQFILTMSFYFVLFVLFVSLLSGVCIAWPLL